MPLAPDYSDINSFPLQRQDGDARPEFIDADDVISSPSARRIGFRSSSRTATRMMIGTGALPTSEAIDRRNPDRVSSSYTATMPEDGATTTAATMVAASPSYS